MRRAFFQAALSAVVAAASVLPVRAGDVEFRVLDGAETWLRSAMDQWRRTELARQGGKFGSHGWWPWGLRAFDYDNDGDLDLLPSHHGTPRSIVLKSLLVETGKLRFVDATARMGIGSPDLPMGDDRPWIWDFNGDGRGDVVFQAAAAYGGDYFGRYFLRAADGKLADRTTEIALPEIGAPIAIEDLTGDGRPEVLIAEKTTGGLYVNDGRGRFTRVDGELSAFLTRRGPYLLRAYRADFDNDGDWDMVLSNPRGRRVEVHENTGGGAFRRIVSARAWDSNPVVVCDIDNDGRMDLAVGGPGAKEPTDITIYLNRTKSAGGFCQVCPRMPKPNPFAVGAVVEAYEAGRLGTKGAAAFFIEKAHSDGTPVHIGLGRAEAFDLRIRFPDGTSVSRANVRAGRRMTVSSIAGSD